MRNESLTRHSFLFKLVKDYDFDEGMMEKTSFLLRRRSLLDKGGHLVYALAEEEREIQQLSLSEMHQKSDMIGINLRISPLTCEISHDGFHKGCITI